MLEFWVANMQIGDSVSFGKYDWHVLAIHSNLALIVTDRIIEQRSYHNKYVEITWADCSLREYLNKLLQQFFNRGKVKNNFRIE